MKKILDKLIKKWKRKNGKRGKYKKGVEIEKNITNYISAWRFLGNGIRRNYIYRYRKI